MFLEICSVCVSVCGFFLSNASACYQKKKDRILRHQSFLDSEAPSSLVIRPEEHLSPIHRPRPSRSTPATLPCSPSMWVQKPIVFLCFLPVASHRAQQTALIAREHVILPRCSVYLPCTALHPQSNRGILLAGEQASDPS
jgi:hypothetical protein